MVRVGLQISATLENIDKLETDADYAFFFKLTCSNCGETSDKWHDVIESERVQQDSRNPDGFNFYMKCKMCGRENSIDVVEKTSGKLLKCNQHTNFDYCCTAVAYTADDAGSFKTIVVFDCRGVEPVEFSPRSGWKVQSAENGQSFEDVDLSDDDWVEYDQKNNNSVGIYEFASKFIKLKK
ncbi:hypothetical protein KR093_003981 [Drosophila rubida]|uniref:Uncharacterized protein n=1 Tax=Drosophila rubida TaxID=30044 RepID=A0AAD4PQI2_9MUSC|nr:hypothetical protein KR093_003981 [Drosophila rubida]